MRVFFSVDFVGGEMPTKIAAIIVAEDEEQARRELREKLQKLDLSDHQPNGSLCNIIELNTDWSRCLVISEFRKIH